MDNTRVITPPNATPYVMAKNNKMLQNKTTTNLAHSVPMYPMNGRQGAQIFMNTQSILTATKMQFSPGGPQRTKSSNDIDLSHLTSYSTVTSATFTSSCNKAFFAKTNTNSQISPDHLMFQQEFLYSTNFGNHSTMVGGGSSCGGGGNQTSNHSKMLSSCDSKFFNSDSPKHAHDTAIVGGKTILNSLKSMVHSWFKPIVDVVGTDHGHSKSSTAAITATAQMASATTTTMSNHKTGLPPTTYCDKQNCTDSFCRSIDNKQQQQQPATMPYSQRECEFFDCDDYIDGGEDTIDFVADSTKFVSHAFGDEFQATSTKDSIYYDCLTKSDLFETPVPTPPPQPPTTAYELPPSLSDSEDSGMENTHEINVDQSESKEQQQLDDTVQYGDNEKATSATAGPIKSNRNAYRRRQRGRRKQQQNNNNNTKSSNKYWKKGCAPNKNRHEKQRHEIEMDLHDDLDIENCSYGAEEDFDLEIIDLDIDERSPKSSPTTTAKSAMTKMTMQSATPAKPIHSSKVCIETPVPSPEKIESNCIFTRFFPFKPSSSLRFIKNFQVPQLACRPPLSKGCLRAPVAMRRVSESESDDSFIVFEDVKSPPATITSTATTSSSSQDTTATYQKRPRQLSECSDDFILFEDGSDDVCLRYDTTDEDFYLTDSTDDDTDSCSSSDDGELFDTNFSDTHLHITSFCSTFK